MGINSLFFYENQKFRPQGGPFIYIAGFFEGVKVKFFALYKKTNKYRISFSLNIGYRTLKHLDLNGKAKRSFSPKFLWGNTTIYLKNWFKIKLSAPLF